MKKTLYLLLLAGLVPAKTSCQEESELSGPLFNDVEMHFDVGSIIDIQSPGDVEKKRESVIEFIWGDEGFPLDKMPSAVTEGIEDGDFEQRVPGLYQRANYLELYLMGAHGEGRSQLQILNEYDACCFGGTGYTSYENILKETLNKLGKGKYGVFLDSSHRLHQISPLAIEVIVEYLKNN